MDLTSRGETRFHKRYLLTWLVSVQGWFGQYSSRLAMKGDGMTWPTTLFFLFLFAPLPATRSGCFLITCYGVIFHRWKHHGSTGQNKTHWGTDTQNDGGPGNFHSINSSDASFFFGGSSHLVSHKHPGYHVVWLDFLKFPVCDVILSPSSPECGHCFGQQLRYGRYATFGRTTSSEWCYR